jgi:hypothetical protein
VPRRLLLTPVLDAKGSPPATPANIRHARLWPGAESAYPSNSTVLRGRVRRGATLDSAVPVRWARILVTLPPDPLSDPPVFDAAAVVGWAHGDDRGEFLIVLGAGAVPGGAALPASLMLWLWVHLPPAAADPVALQAALLADPLADLPLEFAGSADDGEVLAGRAVPAGYTRAGAVALAVTPGSSTVLANADLRF